mmetsp:Transcript_79867/g.191766  ORF Transcript_79867/g.191766 Transcript_79867/m.191766 type:complete len:209 (+) Transcript_79867:722-1348(+)
MIGPQAILGLHRRPTFFLVAHFVQHIIPTRGVRNPHVVKVRGGVVHHPLKDLAVREGPRHEGHRGAAGALLDEVPQVHHTGAIHQQLIPLSLPFGVGERVKDVDRICVRHIKAPKSNGDPVGPRRGVGIVQLDALPWLDAPLFVAHVIVRGDLQLDAVLLLGPVKPAIGRLLPHPGLVEKPVVQPVLRLLQQHIPQRRHLRCKRACSD